MACPCKRNRNRNRCKRRRPCCRLCDEDDISFAPPYNSCPSGCCKNEISIRGEVRKCANPVPLATVTITNGKNVYAECLTDCCGEYSFKGEAGSYMLCAHKGGRRSDIKTLNSCKQKEFNINFRI